MNVVQKIRKLLDRILFTLCVVIMVALVIDVSWQVLSRYLLGSPSTFTDEAARYLMVWMTFLGGAYMFGCNGHLCVTSVRDHLPPLIKSVVIVATYILIAAFALLVMLYGSQRLILRTLSQPSPSLGIPMGWFYGILPLSAVCIIAYTVLNLIDFFTTGTQTEKKVETQ
ncbi:MAG: TRAP transporter small permease [Succinatimonas hippei]|nr:TRAP transporter small permease [Succinatimonas hippei]